MRKRLCVIIFLLLFSLNSNASQKRVLLKEVDVPFLGAYTSLECPTYVTDTIYFKGEADLVGGSSEKKATSIVINGKETQLKEGCQPDIPCYSRHPEVVIIEHKDTTIDLTYFAWDDSRRIPIRLVVSQDGLKDCSQRTSDSDLKKKMNEVCVIDSSSDCSTNRNNCSPVDVWRWKKDSYYLSWFAINPTKDSQNDGLMLLKTRRPHTLFMKDSNLYTIQEEKWSIPIFNLFFPELVTISIKYFLVQLTDGKKILKKPIFTFPNLNRAVNGAFLLFIVYIMCNKAFNSLY